MSDNNKLESQYVVFHLLDNNFALQVEKVLEVLRMVAVTPLPEAPEWLSGVINLRGTVIPVMDLRAWLGQPVLAPGLNTPIIIIEAEQRPVGLLVDFMGEVVTIPDEALTLPDQLASQVHPVKAIGQVADYLVLILDLDHITASVQTLNIEELIKAYHDLSDSD